MDLLRIVIKKVDQDVEGDPPLEDPGVVLQVLSKILQVDPQDPDLGVLSHLIMDLPLVEMDLLTTASKDLHLEEVGAVSTVEVAEVLTAVVEVLTATEVEAAEVAEVFATDLLDLEDLDPGIMVDQEDLLDQDQIGIKVLVVLTAVLAAVAEETVEAVEVLTVGVAEVLMTAMDQTDQIGRFKCSKFEHYRKVENYRVEHKAKILIVFPGTKVVLVVQTAVVLATAAVLVVVVGVTVEVVEVLTRVTDLPAVVLAIMTVEVAEVVVEVKTAEVKDLEVNLYLTTAKKGRVGPYVT